MRRAPHTALMAVGLLTIPAYGLIEFPDCARGPLASNIVCDTKATPSHRAAALVKAMTLDEKLVNLVDQARGAPRLGLPAYPWWSEALHGVARSPGINFSSSGEFSHATSFSNPITLSAAFDDDLVEKVAVVISTEVRAFINARRAGLDVWTPNINPYKDPRWGRGMETPGEDPLRIRGYVKALLKGLEGNSTTKKVIATCKHYAAYDLERWHGIVRYGFDAIVTLQDLSEYYLPAFQECARDSKVGSIMCSYNALNGTPACANAYLMHDILRDHWNWTEHNNYITSDCNAVMEYGQRGYYKSLAHAAGAAYTAGTDTVCEVPGYNGTDVMGAYNNSLLSNATVDTALSRLYEGLVRAGYFDPPSSSPYGSISWKDVNTPDAQALALQSAVDGIVLTKNDELLPLDLAGKSVALIGHWASGTWNMLGGYSGTPPFYRNAAYAAEHMNLTYYLAPGPVAPDSSVTDTWTARAVEAARKADIVLYFGGNDMTLEREDLDRESIAWPQAQLDLVNKLSALGKPMVVAELGDQNDDTPILNNKNISAIVWAGFPGQAGGEAVFNILTGKNAPAGRLPVVQYPANYTSLVKLTNMNLRKGAENPGRTYRWYENPVLHFGHGLHYTTFRVGLDVGLNGTRYAISDLLNSCSASYKDLCPFPPVNITVENAGNTTSDFVALAFLAGEYGTAPYPIKTLASYRRLRDIKPGTKTSVKMEITIGTLARTDEIGNLVLYPGRYELLLDVPTQSRASFTLIGEEMMLDKFPQPKL